MNVIVLDAFDDDVIRRCGAGADGSHVIALHPLATDALAERGHRPTTTDDYRDLDENCQLGRAIYERLTRFCRDADDAFNEMSAFGGARLLPFAWNVYQLKMLTDVIVFNGRLANRMREIHRPAAVTLFADRPRRGEQCWSLPAVRLATIASVVRQRGMSVRTVSRAAPWRELARRSKVLRSLQFLRRTRQSCRRHDLGRSIRSSGDWTMLLVHPHYDVEFAIDDIASRSRALYFFTPSESALIVGSRRTYVYRPASAASDWRRRQKDFWAKVEQAAAAAELVAPEQTAFLIETLRQFYDRFLPTVRGHAIAFERQLERLGVDRVVAGNFCVEPLDRLLIESAKRIGVPTFTWQHGGAIGYVDKPVDEHLLNETDCFLSYGDGVRDSTYGRRSTTRFVTVGSARLTAEARRATRRTVTSPGLTLSYVPTPFIDYNFYFPDFPFSGHVQHQFRKDFIRFCAGRPGVRLIVKLADVAAVAERYRTIVRQLRASNITIETTRSVIDLAKDTDEFVIDWPATALLESLQTDRPVHVVRLAPYRYLDEGRLLARRARLHDTAAGFLRALEDRLDREAPAPNLTSRAFLDRFAEPYNREHLIATLEGGVVKSVTSECV